MAIAVHKQTLEVLLRVEPRSLVGLPTDWLINPSGLRALIGVGTATAPQTPKEYWIIDQGNLRERTANEKLILDTDPTLLAQTKALKKAVLLGMAQDFVDSRYDERLQRAFQQIRQSSLATGAVLTQLNTYNDWLGSVYMMLVTRLDAVDVATTVTAVRAVRFNMAPLITSDPGLTLQALL